MTTGNPLSFDIASPQLNYGDGLVRFYYPKPPDGPPSGCSYVATLPITAPGQPPGTFDPEDDDDGSGTRAYWAVGCSPPCTTCHHIPCGTPPEYEPRGGDAPALALSNTLSFGIREVLTPATSGFASLLVIASGTSLRDVLQQIEDVYGQTSIKTFHVYALDPAANLGGYIVLPVAAAAPDLPAALATFFTPQ
jgi:hypothetical protein